MSIEDRIEKIIHDFFDDAAGSKLDREPNGRLFDNDSNWGFHPYELAHRIAREIETKEAAK